MNKILDLMKHLNKEDLHTGVRMILIELRIPPALMGYHCLAEAVCMFYQNPRISLTKELYPEVGKKVEPNQSREQVEKNIRYAIDTAWEQRNHELWDRYFPGDQRPTNHQFISKLAEILKLWKSCW